MFAVFGKMPSKKAKSLPSYGSIKTGQPGKTQQNQIVSRCNVFPDAEWEWINPLFVLRKTNWFLIVLKNCNRIGKDFCG